MKDRFVLLLRGVNVGGVTLPMAEFRDMLTGLGLERVATHIQSGNAVFLGDGTGLEARIAAALSARFGLAVPLFLWTLAEYEALLAACPYQAEAEADGSKVHVVFHRAVLAPGLAAHASASERFSAGEGALYLALPQGFGTSALVKALPRYLKGPQTTRNWRSASAVRDLAQGLGAGTW